MSRQLFYVDALSRESRRQLTYDPWAIVAHDADAPCLTPFGRGCSVVGLRLDLQPGVVKAFEVSCDCLEHITAAGYLNDSRKLPREMTHATFEPVAPMLPRHVGHLFHESGFVWTDECNDE